MTEFHEVLRSLRKEQNVTQQEIADALNITQPTYNKYEKGTREPDMKTLISIANYFKVSLDFLTGRYGSNE